MSNEAQNLLGDASDKLSCIQAAMHALYLLTSESNIHEFKMVARLIEPNLDGLNEVSDLLDAAAHA